jgi:ATP-binding cassette subfamily F protein 3
MIQAVGISKNFGARNLFEDVTFSLNKGERVGLVGRNGTGKSTLFKIILGSESYDQGDLTIPKGYKLGTLEQHIKFTCPTVISECMSVLPKEYEYETYRAEKFLFGLGFTKDDMEKDPMSFSGGYQIRINLVKTLLTEPNCLLLDEPTNYLDIVSLRWLRSFLKTFDGEVVLITHDKEFMNSVVTHTMGLWRKKLKKIKGSTDKYYSQLEEEDRIYEQTRVNQEKKIQQMQDYVDKFRAKARGASQAQSKLKAIEKLGTIDELEAVTELKFNFNHTECPAKIVLDIREVSFGFDHPLFEKVKFSLGKNDRIGIIGKNGKGKSTFLNTIAGIHQPTEGEIWNHSSLSLGHFGQTNVSRLHPNNNIIQEIQEMNMDLNISAVRGICGTMLFSGDDAEKKISVLSGGEKARVLLGKILAKKTNVLLLDEPTNHLDMESIDALMEAIDDYDGACLIVTHSEEILKRCVNKLVIFRKDHAEFFDGNYEDFLEKIGWDSEEEGREKKEKVVSTKKKKTGNAQVLAEREKEIMEQIETLENYQNLLEKNIERYSIEGNVEGLQSSTDDLTQVQQKIEDLFIELEEITS